MIIILFSVVIIAVGNMVTMSSFSTSLSNNITMFINYMSDLSDDLEEYGSITWLMDYWRENANTLVTKDERMDEKGNIDDILGEERLESLLSEVSPEDTPETIMKKVRTAVDGFAGDTPQYDDLTMLCLVIN